MKKKLISIGDSTYRLLIEDFEDEVDIDDLLKIDYSNLIGEIMTFPVIVNRFGTMLAEMESQVAEKKLNLEVFEAKVKERLRNSLAEENGGKAPSVDSLNTAVTLDKGYQAMRKAFIEAQKNRDFVQSIFWSSKDKSGKLDKLSLSIQPGDVEEHLIEGKVNGIMMKKAKNLIG